MGKKLRNFSSTHDENMKPLDFVSRGISSIYLYLKSTEDYITSDVINSIVFVDD